MLSRHAEDLFWLGRYVERAEDTARMLDVTFHHVLESPPSFESTAWRELLEVLYLDEVYEGPIVGRDVSTYLVTDRDNPGSVVSAIERARDNARGLRDRISTELWEAINMFYLELSEADLTVGVETRTYDLLRRIKSRCQLINGVAAQTMPRDEGYRFIVLGLMLERAEMTCRLLSIRYARLVGSGEPLDDRAGGRLVDRFDRQLGAPTDAHIVHALDPEMTEAALHGPSGRVEDAGLGRHIDRVAVAGHGAITSSRR